MLTVILWSCADGNCIHMVDNGIVQKLMDLLDRHVEDGNVTVQHAALSALRNLAIPGKQGNALPSLQDSYSLVALRSPLIKFSCTKMCGFKVVFSCPAFLVKTQPVT